MSRRETGENGQPKATEQGERTQTAFPYETPSRKDVLRDQEAFGAVASSELASLASSGVIPLERREKKSDKEGEKKLTDTNNYGVTSRESIEAELRTRASKDKEFRHKLLTDTHATLQQNYPEWFPSGKIPEYISLKVIEEDEHTGYIVLPHLQDDNSIEVDENILETVYGGLASRFGAFGGLEREDTSTRNWTNCSHSDCSPSTGKTCN